MRKKNIKSEIKTTEGERGHTHIGIFIYLYRKNWTGKHLHKQIEREKGKVTHTDRE